MMTGKMTYGKILSEATGILSEAGVEEAALDAFYLFEEAFGIDRTHYFLKQMDPVDPESQECAHFSEMIEKRSQRIPLQYILGNQEFMGMSFHVDENVLIPRQDTETLVELFLRENPEKDLSVLDLCTGSGCIAISLAALGGYRHVKATDLSDGALQTARKNAENILKEKADTQMEFQKSDLFQELSGERFDRIVSNPPYIPTEVILGLAPEVKDHEPMMALDGTADGLIFYRRLAEECPDHLTEHGKVYFEIGHDQGESVSELLAMNGFTEIKVIKDLAGKDRVVCGTKASS